MHSELPLENAMTARDGREITTIITVWAEISNILLNKNRIHYFNSRVHTCFLTCPFLGGLETQKEAGWRHFPYEWGMSPAGRSTVLYETALFAFLNPRHEAFSRL